MSLSRKLWVMALSLLMSLRLQAQLSQPPKPLNLREVKMSIGYPPLAREAEIEGVVRIGVQVDEKGDVVCVMVWNDPLDLLTKAVLKEVPRLKFVPGVIDGEKVPSWVTIPYRFELEGFSEKKRQQNLYPGYKPEMSQFFFPGQDSLIGAYRDYLLKVRECGEIRSENEPVVENAKAFYDDLREKHGEPAGQAAWVLHLNAEGSILSSMQMTTGVDKAIVRDGNMLLGELKIRPGTHPETGEPEESYVYLMEDWYIRLQR